MFKPNKTHGLFAGSITIAVCLTLLITITAQPELFTKEVYGPSDAQAPPQSLGAPINGTFYWPRGVAFHPLTNNLFVADTQNGRIQEFTVNGTEANFVKAFGFPGNQRNDGSLNQPYDLSFSPFNNLHVADTFSNLIKVYNPDTGNHIATFGGSGNGDREFYYPSGIEFNGLTGVNGTYAMADTFNNRIQILSATDNSFLYEIPLNP